VDRAFNLVAGLVFAAVGLVLAMNLRNSADWLADHARFSFFFKPPPEKRAAYIRGLGWVWLVGALLLFLVAVFR